MPPHRSRFLPAIAVVALSALALWSCAGPAVPPLDPCAISPTMVGPSQLSPRPASALSSCATPRITEGCQTIVAVSVSGGITPRIDWNPQCGITHLVVVSVGSDGQPGPLVWSFSASELALVGPGVRYSVLPPGAILEGPTRPLLIGGIYRVTLEMITGADLITGHGSATFRP